MTNDYVQEDPMSVYSTKLSARHALNARELGEGNLSRGIRAAIELAYKIKKEGADTPPGGVYRHRMK